ncbi:MAG: membrane protein insertase YidC [Oscillospiraceae bacterium]|nr:membrane protein insertase YidC [Oscillospiraceae bacterium]
MNFITVPFNWLLMTLYNFVQNYGLAVILFALIVKIILLPFQMKSKHSMMRTASIAPQLQELQKKYADNKQKYQEEATKLYREEGIKPMSGCLWNLIPLPILIALYGVIRQPLKHAMGMSAERITELTDKLVSMGAYTIPEKADPYAEVKLANIISENFEKIKDAFPEVLDINYNFLGINLGQKPEFKFWQWDYSDPKVYLPLLGMLLIPILSAVLSWLQSYITSKTTPNTGGNDQAAAQMKSMAFMMPLFSLYIGFSMPAALGVYWIAQYVFGIIQEVILNKYYGKKIAAEEAIRKERWRIKEEILEEKRQETERLRAEGKLQANANTSKKKLQAQERNKEEQRKAAKLKEEMRQKRIEMGLPPEEEKPESQVGNRRYARGRAYVADRYTNPETAAERTRLAAEASEGAASIDETVPDATDLIDSAAEITETAEVEVPEIEAPEPPAESTASDPWEAPASPDPWEGDKSDKN